MSDIRTKLADARGQIEEVRTILADAFRVGVRVTLNEADYRDALAALDAADKACASAQEEATK